MSERWTSFATRDGAGHDADPRLLTLILGIVYSGLAAPVLMPGRPAFPPGDAAATVVLAVMLIALSVIDLRTFRLPDLLTLPLIAAGVVLSQVLEWDPLETRLIGAVLGFGALYLTGAVYERIRGRPGLGLGDAKLLAASGAWLGAVNLPSVVLWACLAGFAAAGYAALRGAHVNPTTALPFGPCLALGTWLVWLYGPIF